MKPILPWCVALALLAALTLVYRREKESDESKLMQLRQDNDQLTALRAENEELKKVRVQVEELARLRKENEELHRLRNEVHQLRSEKQQASNPGFSAPDAAQAKANAVTQQQMQQQLQQLLAENDRLRAENQRFVQAGIDAQVGACVNNLRQIDGAKQQWALENKKTADAVPSVQDLLPYFKGETFPVCPSGGAYGVNGVSLPPTCSVAGHVLPQ